MTVDTPNQTVLDLTQQGSILKQVECASEANTPYSAFEGLNFLLSDAFPEMIGYMFAYNFSGLGSNDSHFFGKMGFLDLKDSKRILGFNYFLPMNPPNTPKNKRKKCSEMSGECAGLEPHLYIRGYPTSNSGNMSFAIFEDVLDLNPALLIQAMFTAMEPGGPECVKLTLPVGSNFNFCGNKPELTEVNGVKLQQPLQGIQFGYQKNMTNVNGSVNPTAVQEFHNNCKTYCSTLYGDEKTKFQLNNCQKDCARIWWEETRCAIKPLYTEPVNYPTCGQGPDITYHIPIGKHNKKKTQQKTASQPKLGKSVYAPGEAPPATKITEKFQNANRQATEHIQQYRYRCLGYIVIASFLCFIIIVLCVYRYFT